MVGDPLLMRSDFLYSWNKLADRKELGMSMIENNLLFIFTVAKLFNIWYT